MDALGAAAATALPTLIAALADNHLNVRYWALSAIKKLAASMGRRRAGEGEPGCLTHAPRGV